MNTLEKAFQRLRRIFCVEAGQVSLSEKYDLCNCEDDYCNVVDGDHDGGGGDDSGIWWAPVWWECPQSWLVELPPCQTSLAPVADHNDDDDNADDDDNVDDHDDHDDKYPPPSNGGVTDTLFDNHQGSL